MATRKIGCGEVILIENSGFNFARFNARSEVCTHCLGPKLDLIPSPVSANVSIVFFHHSPFKNHKTVKYSTNFSTYIFARCCYPYFWGKLRLKALSFSAISKIQFLTQALISVFSVLN